MKAIKWMVLILVIFVNLSGCAYRYYMGMHGPSIKATMDIHEGVVEDRACLECHHPEMDPEGPPTTHPHFKGCLKCHNDSE